MRRAADRGEIVESDTQKLAANLQQQAHKRVKAADQARIELTEQATAALFENANGILKRLGVPEMKVVFPNKPAQAGGATPAEADSAPA